MTYKKTRSNRRLLAIAVYVELGTQDVPDDGLSYTL